MTYLQVINAMEVLCPRTSFSSQIDSNGTLVWIRLEEAGTCPTVDQVIAQVG